MGVYRNALKTTRSAYFPTLTNTTRGIYLIQRQN